MQEGRHYHSMFAVDGHVLQCSSLSFYIILKISKRYYITDLEIKSDY
jgi:hypothetical protein